MTAARMIGARMIVCFWHCSVMLKTVKTPASDISFDLHYSDRLFFLDAKSCRSQQLVPCIRLVQDQGLSSAFNTSATSLLLICFVMLHGEGFCRNSIAQYLFTASFWNSLCFRILYCYLQSLVSINPPSPTYTEKTLTQTVKPTLHVTPFSNYFISSIS